MTYKAVHLFVSCDFKSWHDAYSGVTLTIFALLPFATKANWTSHFARQCQSEITIFGQKAHGKQRPFLWSNSPPFSTVTLISNNLVNSSASFRAQYVYKYSSGRSWYFITTKFARVELCMLTKAKVEDLPIVLLLLLTTTAICCVRRTISETVSKDLQFLEVFHGMTAASLLMSCILNLFSRSRLIASELCVHYILQGSIIIYEIISDVSFAIWEWSSAPETFHCQASKYEDWRTSRRLWKKVCETTKF